MIQQGFKNISSFTPLTFSKFSRSLLNTKEDALFSNLRGKDIILDPVLNKGTSFTKSERDRLGFRGLLPPRETTIGVQLNQISRQYSELEYNMEKYIFLRQLQDSNETLFFRFIMSDIEKFAPIIYTPTVGQACKEFSQNFLNTRGMYFSLEDVGEMETMMYNNPQDQVDVICVTDGGRILGLGDLGVNGMGIPIGKLNLYVAAGGVHPARVLPITLDMGTNNEDNLVNPGYLGLQRPRIDGEKYFEVLDEFVEAVSSRYPDCLIQFEDFTPDKANIILEKYKNKHLSFNDDIQGTGAVIVSGVLNGLRVRGKEFDDIVNQKIVFLGAGCAGTGIAKAIAYAMMKEGLTKQEAYERMYFVDKDGSIANDRLDELTNEQRDFCQYRKDIHSGMNLVDTIKKVEPTVLIGTCGQKGLFTQEVIEEMSRINDKPIIFPLSNPTSKSECTAEEAIYFSEGRAIFASGSPFPPVEYDGKTYYTSQGNNMFIFPAVGLASVLVKAQTVSDGMFYEASKALANCVSLTEIVEGRVYPQISNIRNVSMNIATKVIERAIREDNYKNIDQIDKKNLKKFVIDNAWNPKYSSIIYKN